MSIESTIKELSDSITPFEKNGVVLVGVPGNAVMNIWPLCRHLVQRPLKHEASLIDETFVIQCLADKRMQLWFALDKETKEILGCAVTQLIPSFRGLVCSMVLIGGVDMERWLDFEDTFCEWARYYNCIAMEGYDFRKGPWLRRLFNRGWRASHLVIRKNL